ncbi:retrovirus-related pol polyprotein from transposon TNT 1-94 [Tanacetum coccineum]
MPILSTSQDNEAIVLRDLVGNRLEINNIHRSSLNLPYGSKTSTSASGSQPSGNTKKDKIQQTPSSTQKNKHSKLNANSKLKCVKCNGCMLSDNHDLCVLDSINNVNARTKSKSDCTTGRTFTIVGNVCPLTRITTTTEVPLRKLTALENETPKPVVTLVYSQKPRKSKTNVPVSKSKVLKSASANKKEPSESWGSIQMTGDRSQLTNFVNKFLGTVKFGNDHVAKILGYGDYQIRNVTISRVYYVEGLGHNLFSVGQFCDSNLEVAFRQHTCFIRNLEGVDLLTGSRGNNLYTLSLGDMMASSPICLLSKASKTKSWLWHRRLSHLNFGAINHLARHGLVRGLPKLKFEKDHLCSACAMGKSKKKPHKPKSEDTNQEKLYLLHMDLCGPMRVASVNGKKYILVIVDDYSRFTWVKCLRSKDEAPDFIIKFLKMIQVRLKVPVRRIRTDNGTEFVNQTLREYYEKVGISHETSVARSPQQNEAVATACYTQNRSIIRLRHDKTPYELLHDKPPDLSFLHVFGALCYPTNDSENLGKLQPKADIGIFIGYAPTMKAFRIYNLRTRRIIEIIHVDFDELTAMASEHSSSGSTLYKMTPTTISSGLMPNLIGIFCFNRSGSKQMQEEPMSFERLEVWELVPRPTKFMVITLKWIYKVKLDELGAPRAWYDMLSSFLISQDFFKGSVDPTQFIRLQIFQNPRGIFFNQSKYALESLKKYGFDSCDLVDTPMVEKSKLDEDKEGKAVDPSHYRGMIGTLLYLTASRPDLQFAICMCAHYQASLLKSTTWLSKGSNRYLKRNRQSGPMCIRRDSSIA